jgi:hypothetical protein
MGNSSESSLNNNLPAFLTTHASIIKNKIFLENSPERKTHDNMLLKNRDSMFPEFKSEGKGKGHKLFVDESNVIDKIKSSKIMDNDIFHEIMISKQEKSAKAYT